MAEQIKIEEVKDLLPADANWNDVKIAGYLDAGKTVPETMQLFWEARASKLYTMIDISESGSSRSLSRLYDNAIKLAEYWAGKVAKEKEEKKEEKQEEDRRIRFNTITRV